MSSTINIVYDKIAKEFDKTRYSVWKHVGLFLDEIPEYSVGAEVGVGNGKNIKYRKDLVVFGNDISLGQSKIASQNLQLEKCIGDVFVCSSVRLPYKDATMDFMLCIAVLHHLPFSQERYTSIREMIRVTKSKGKILISVWAKEQKIKDNWNHLGQNDYMIPWVMKDGKTSEHRFYHLSKEQEIKNICDYFSKSVLDINYWFYMDNWYIQITK
jgi:tRNA (uracil-5-)-methyltransferase TRM9